MPSHNSSRKPSHRLDRITSNQASAHSHQHTPLHIGPTTSRLTHAHLTRIYPGGLPTNPNSYFTHLPPTHLARHLFFQAEIFLRKTDLHHQYRVYDLRHLKLDPDCQAIVMPRRIHMPTGDATSRYFKHRFLGYALFHADMLNAEIISHEAVHMACYYLRRLNLSLTIHPDTPTNHDREERLAYTIGIISDQLSLMTHTFKASQ